jgi:hypothetical protein
MKKANHQANIIRVTDIKKHTNADTLDIITIGEYQVVSKSGQFHVGDLAVYIQPDSVVPQTEPFKFIWEPYLCMNDVVPEKRRRITVRKFRGEWSEGLLLPVNDFDELVDSVLTRHFVENDYPEGTDVSDLLGITHYDPDAGKEAGETSHGPKLKKKYPRNLKGWYNWLVRKIKNLLGIGGNLTGANDNVSLGIPVYDVDNYKNYKNVFVDGEKVKVTEKIHGSNARYLFLDGVMYAGSRKLWKSSNSNCIFRRALKELPWIEEWCREHEGHVLWGEITPTQGGYEYGSKNVQFFIFDVLGPDGTWLEDDNEFIVQLQAHFVPVLYKGPYSYEVISKLVDGKSTIKSATNIREGIVVRSIPERHVIGLGRAQLKMVSLEFLERDSKN